MGGDFVCPNPMSLGSLLPNQPFTSTTPALPTYKRVRRGLQQQSHRSIRRRQLAVHELLVGAVGDVQITIGTYTQPTGWSVIDSQGGSIVEPLMDAWEQAGLAGSYTFNPTSSSSIGGNIGLVAIQIA